MLCFSSLLKSDTEYRSVAVELFDALDRYNVKYGFVQNTKDIWLRDFMPVKSRNGNYISFRYEPSYLKKDIELQTDFKSDIAPWFSFPITYSEINLDGGNVVFSPSGEKAVVSDRVFSENPHIEESELVRKLERILETRVVIIPSLKSDMTGHADGMVRFIDENTALCNPAEGKNTLETRIAEALKRNGIGVVSFPYFSSPGCSAIGCYLNYLETENCIFLPIFDSDMDKEAVQTAKSVFKKAVVPIGISKIAERGGCLNCISWEKE